MVLRDEHHVARPGRLEEVGPRLGLPARVAGEELLHERVVGQVAVVLAVVRLGRAALDGEGVLVPLDVRRAAHRLLPPAAAAARSNGESVTGAKAGHGGRGPVDEDAELGVVEPLRQRSGARLHAAGT